MAKIKIIEKKPDEYCITGNLTEENCYYKAADGNIYFSTAVNVICLTDSGMSYSGNKHCCYLKLKKLSNCTINIEV